MFTNLYHQIYHVQLLRLTTNFCSVIKHWARQLFLRNNIADTCFHVSSIHWNLNESVKVWRLLDCSFDCTFVEAVSKKRMITDCKCRTRMTLLCHFCIEEVSGTVNNVTDDVVLRSIRLSKRSLLLCGLYSVDRFCFRSPFSKQWWTCVLQQNK